ncbi:MAG TPA: 50S ribosomal protein L3 [Thermotogota bacterium]|nr:50S ribosomal protein L3 [Thermotogota bacterium]HRW91376.1 50S ribosomal protein L3 [Thermotogota bacterium]
MSGLLGKKIGMTRLYRDGVLVPVTLIQAGPCTVVQKKTKDTDGYNAIQLGYGSKKEKNTTKPLKGHFKKANVQPKAWLKEFRVQNPDDYELGEQLTVSLFSESAKIDVIGWTKGRGYSGVMKRWNFRGGEKSHGSKFHRGLGSTGQHSYPARVFPGKKMPGRYGNERVTIQNLEIIRIDEENNVVAVKGSIPGAKNSKVIIRNAIKRKAKKNR